MNSESVETQMISVLMALKASSDLLNARISVGQTTAVSAQWRRRDRDASRRSHSMREEQGKPVFGNEAVKGQGATKSVIAYR